MFTANATFRSFAFPMNAMPNAERTVDALRRYFVRHPEVAPQEFVLQAIEKEIGAREQTEAPAFHAAPAPTKWVPPSAEDVRIHAWLNSRLKTMHQQRHGLWSKIRRLLPWSN
jgi:hypothetical protein